MRENVDQLDIKQKHLKERLDSEPRQPVARSELGSHRTRECFLCAADCLAKVCATDARCQARGTLI